MTKRSDIIVTDRFFCALFRKSCLLQRFAPSFRSSGDGGGGGGGGWGGGEGGAASRGGGAVDGGSVNAFLAPALTRVMRAAVPILVDLL